MFSKMSEGSLSETGKISAPLPPPSVAAPPLAGTLRHALLDVLLHCYRKHEQLKKETPARTARRAMALFLRPRIDNRRFRQILPIRYLTNRQDLLSRLPF